MDENTCLNDAKHDWDNVGSEWIDKWQREPIFWCKQCGSLKNELEEFITPEYGRGTGW